MQWRSLAWGCQGVEGPGVGIAAFLPGLGLAKVECDPSGLTPLVSRTFFPVPWASLGAPASCLRTD